MNLYIDMCKIKVYNENKTVFFYSLQPGNRGILNVDFPLHLANIMPWIQLNGIL